MTRSLGRRAGAVVLLTALFAVIPASPAAAEPVITVDQPRDGQTHETTSVSFSGRVTNSSPLYSVRTVTLAAAGRTHRIDCEETPCPFSWRIDVPANGPYTLKVTATESTILLGTAAAPANQTRSFKVAAPPATPVLDTPKVNENRNVDLSWSRNTEPDILHYAVFRRDPGSSDFRRVGGDVAQPDSGAKVRYTDTTTGASNGGDYAYRVVAVRNGASGTAESKITSGPSGIGTAAVPLSTTTSTTPAPPGAPAAPGAPPTTARAGPPAGVDLSGFLSPRSQPTPVAPITVPEPPDTGFQGALPFGAVPPGADLEEGEAEAVPPRGRGSSSSVVSTIDSGRPLVPVAGGLVLLMLALHMRLLSRRIKVAAAGTDLPVDVPAPAPAPVPAPAPAPVAAAEEAPRRAVYDILEQEDWAPVVEAPEPVAVAEEPSVPALSDIPEEDDWAPVVEEPEPEPEPAPVAVGEEAPRPALSDLPEEEDWAPLIEAPEPEPAPVAVAEEAPRPALPDIIEEEDWAPLIEAPRPEPEPEPVALWAPDDDDEEALDDLDEFEPVDDLDELEEISPHAESDEEIEVFEVVSPTRRPLARAGSR